MGRRGERRAVFARVMLALFLLPASLFASKFGQYLLPTLVVLDMVATLGIVRVLDLAAAARRPALSRLATAIAVVAMIGVPAAAQVSAAPNAALFQDTIGARLSAPGRIFPNDELYDAGMREAVTWIAGRARPGAALVSDAPGVVREYLLRSGRTDLVARSLSMQGLSSPPTETWLLTQDSHACFESEQVVEQVSRRQRPDFVHRVRGTAAVRVFRMPW